MKIAWCTPYGLDSAIGKFSSLVVEALAGRDNSITLVSSDNDQLTEHRRTPEGIELLHWSRFAYAPATLDAYDVVVYNIGDHFRFHAGVLGLIDRYPGVCIFHDFYLVNLFRAWCERGLERPMANSIVSSIYGEKVANEFWERIGRPDFEEWSALHAPMTGWVARKALAAVAHAPFYEPLLSEWSAGPVRVIPLAYAASAYVPQLQVQRENRRVRLLPVGTVNPNKRVGAVFHSVAASPLLRARCEYDIVGDIDAPERGRLQSLIDQCGLREVVHLHGAVSDFELRWRYAEADIVCCLRWPALEGSSASCVEAMLHGKAVIVTDTGFYSSIPSDRILKVRPTDEIRDLIEHLEMLVVNSDVRDSLGQRARDWAEVEYAPDLYASRIEPLLEIAARERPVTDALRQIGLTFRAMRVQPEEPIVERIGSEFRSLFCGSDSYTEPSRSISNLLREPKLPAESEGPVGMLPLSLENDFSGASVKSHSLNAAAKAPLRFSSESEPHDDLTLQPANIPFIVSMRQFAGRCAAAILRRARRYSVRHFLFRCAEPILSHLRGYLIGDLFNLTRAVNQRVVAIEQSLGAFEQQLDDILNQIETLASQEEIATFAGEFRIRMENLASRGTSLLEGKSQFSRMTSASRSKDSLLERRWRILRTLFGFVPTLSRREQHD